MFLICFSERRLLAICIGVSYQEMKKNGVYLKRKVIFIVFMHISYFLKELTENAVK